MGLIVPDLNLENVQMSNAYVAIAHYDVNLRNYKPEFIRNAPLIENSNGEPIVTQTGILPGMTILVNYGIWESAEKRNEPPITVRTIQAPFESEIYKAAYDLLKTVFPNAQDDT
jgi:hypothetical protein